MSEPTIEVDDCGVPISPEGANDTAQLFSRLISKATADELTNSLYNAITIAFARRQIIAGQVHALYGECGARLKAMPTPEQYAAVVAQRDELAKSLPIEELELDMRAYNVLYKSHRSIRFVGQLVELTEEDILDMRNAGTKTVENIKARLRDVCGLTLKPGGEQ